MTPIDSIVARLTSLHPKLIDLSLDRMRRILGSLGHPEQQLPPTIHVAGTNGKGSTIAFMRAILEAAGLRVHVYTSPHLVRFNERFRLGGKGEGRLASDEELSSALNECERANAGAPITVFEVTTAAGFLMFARNPADVLLLEVGMGGRLDATNVVDRPLASVITPVSLDHAEHLGDTLGKIAVEKAGILKPGVPAIVAAQPREALLSIERQAGRVKAPIRIAGEDWTATEERGRLVYQDDAGLPRRIGPGACSGSRRDVLRRSCRPAANSGLMVATILTAAVPLPTPSPTWRSVFRARWCLWSACSRPRIAKAS
jgi:dihydrofolate synthase/folylpolyglutamate synthase